MRETGESETSAGPPGWALVAGFSALWLGMLLVSAPGPWMVDEVVYLLAAEALAERGTLFVENGYERFASPHLQIHGLLRAAPEGLAPQYPAGYALLGAPLVAAFGVKGLMALNWLAATACLWLAHRLALRLYGDPAAARLAVLLLGGASFFASYAVSILPHAASAAAVLAVALLAHGALEAEGRAMRARAALAGAVLSLGIGIRVDVAFVAPGIAVWAVLFARRPFAPIPWALLGALPGIALATWLNWEKFAIALPVTYGHAEGDETDPAHYLPLAAAGLAALAGFWGLRAMGARARGWTLLAAAAGLGAAALLVPALGQQGLRLWHGAQVLLLDIRESLDPRPGIVRHADGRVVFWGQVKKALGQSLPWLGALGALAVAPGGPAARRASAFLGLVAAVWILPYAMSAWHGGPGGNMRYFLPILPFLAILGAVAIGRLLGGRPVSLGLALGAGAGLAAAAAVLVALGAGGEASPAVATLVVLSNVLPQWLLGALLAASLLVALGGAAARAAAGAARGLLLAACLLAALLGSVADPLVTQTWRRLFWEASVETRALPAQSLVYSSLAEPFPFLFRREGSHLAMGGLRGPTVDAALLEAALAEGMAIHAQEGPILEAARAALPGLAAERATEGNAVYPPLWRLRRAE